MPYVMVPVPAELENQVNQLVLRLRLSSALNRWDAEAMERLFEACDAPGRSVIVEVALRNLDGEPPTDRAVGDALGIPAAEVVELALRVNAVSTSKGSPALILMRTSLEALDDGGESLVHHLTLAGEPARLALQAWDSRGEARGE